MLGRGFLQSMLRKITNHRVSIAYNETWPTLLKVQTPQKSRTEKDYCYHQAWLCFLQLWTLLWTSLSLPQWEMFWPLLLFAQFRPFFRLQNFCLRSSNRLFRWAHCQANPCHIRYTGFCSEDEFKHSYECFESTKCFYLNFILCGVSIITLVIISIDRLLALRFEIRYRHLVTLLKASPCSNRLYHDYVVLKVCCCSFFGSRNHFCSGCTLIYFL